MIVYKKGLSFLNNFTFRAITKVRTEKNLFMSRFFVGANHRVCPSEIIYLKNDRTSKVPGLNPLLYTILVVHCF